MADIQKMILEDSHVDLSAIDSESAKAISLHAKYIGMWQEERTKAMFHEETYKRVKREKVDYYLGRAPDSVYEEFPLNQRIPRQDLDFYIESDKDLCVAKRNYQNAQNKVDLIHSFITGNLNQRSFHFKNALGFLQWASGK